ncbi:MAG: hypothetical protein KDD82_24530 [Planctomycetes bacterium]|nr:hypothetical protein [Planctomycetota bacterium]
MIVRFLAAAVCCAALAGCTSDGAFRNNITNVTLTSNNYRVIQTGVRGSDVGFKVFGIGPNAQFSKALEKVRILAELDDRPRALVNVTEDVSSYNVGIVSGDSVVITADVIEFTGPPNGR